MSSNFITLKKQLDDEKDNNMSFYRLESKQAEDLNQFYLVLKDNQF